MGGGNAVSPTEQDPFPSYEEKKKKEFSGNLVGDQGKLSRDEKRSRLKISSKGKGKIGGGKSTASEGKKKNGRRFSFVIKRRKKLL